jgi:hypothetical protein
MPLLGLNPKLFDLLVTRDPMLGIPNSKLVDAGESLLCPTTLGDIFDLPSEICLNGVVEILVEILIKQVSDSILKLPLRLTEIVASELL